MTGLDDLIEDAARKAAASPTKRCVTRTAEFLVSCRHGELRDYIHVWDACTGAPVAMVPWSFMHASDSEVGRHIERWYMEPANPPVLTNADCRRIAAWASRFEECSVSPADMLKMSNRDIISTAYWAMADYARGQV